MRAYYGTKISDNMTETPEGYLICQNVPLNRTGWYEYDASELGLDGVTGKVRVFRSPEEVFDPAAIASFEGKTVSDGHPSDYPIKPENEGSYHRGHVQNVRKGSGVESDCTVGDLFIKDKLLIDKIKDGLREVSCGYDCDWVPNEDEKGTYRQIKIRGNHVAVVPDGRAGSRIAIKDEAPSITHKGGKKMAFSLKHIFGLGLKEFAKDAEPEEVAKAFSESEDCFGKKPTEDAFPAPAAPAPAAPATPAAAESQELQILKAILAAITKGSAPAPAAPAAPADALDALEEELKDPEEKEVEDEGADPIPVLPSEDLPKNPISGADSRAAILDAIKTMKPIIAAITDPVARKSASDAMAKSLKDMMGPGKSGGSYAGLLNLKPVEDAKAQDQAAKDEEYGQKLKEKYHRKNIVGGA